MEINVVHLFLVGVLFALVFGSIVVIPAGYVGVLLEFGKPVSVLQEGLHLKIPLVNAVWPVNLQVQKYETEASSASKDLQSVSTTVALNYKLDGDKAIEIYRTLRNDYQERVIAPAVQEAVKASTAKHNAEELITKRPIVRDQIEEKLKQRLSKFGITVIAVSITNFKFSEQFDKAIEQKVVAEQQALKAKFELERQKIEAQKKVVAANATAESKLLEAKAEAEKKRLIADAEAYSIRKVTEALTLPYISYQQIEKWNGKLPEFLVGSDSNLGLLLNIQPTASVLNATNK